MDRVFVSFTSVLTVFFLAMPLYGATMEVALCSPTTMISVDPPTITVVGKTFTININVFDVVDLYGWEFRLRWDSMFLDVVNVTEGTFLKQGGDTFFANKTDNIEGYILVDCTLFGDVPGVSGDGILAVVEFYVEGDGESILDLYDTTLVSSLEQSIIHQSTDGYGHFTNALTGDINGDGIVDIFDVVTVAVAFGSSPGDQNWNSDADLNNDGFIDIYDVVIVAIHFGESAL